MRGFDKSNRSPASHCVEMLKLDKRASRARKGQATDEEKKKYASQFYGKKKTLIQKMLGIFGK